ncbi:hypothetical protein C8R43DRAFT_1136226 [Mycena crocata]|nr:hypothetical protein C8R43DRAFT_1136226 [Mycena crocata]
MPDATTQTEDAPNAATQTEDLTERQFKQEVLNFVEGHGAPPGSDVLRWLGQNTILAKERPKDPKELESTVMEEIRHARSEHLKRLREGWDERNLGRPYLECYPSSKKLAEIKKVAAANLELLQAAQLAA